MMVEPPAALSRVVVICHEYRQTEQGLGDKEAISAAQELGPRTTTVSLGHNADIVFERPPGDETLNVVIPWSDVQFQYASKQNTLPTPGFVQLDGERLDFAAPSFG